MAPNFHAFKGPCPLITPHHSDSRLVHVLWTELCPQPNSAVEVLASSSHPVPQNVTIFGERKFKEVSEMRSGAIAFSKNEVIGGP